MPVLLRSAKGNWTFLTGEEAYLSKETIPGSMGPFCDVLLHVKDGPVLRF